MEIKSIAIKVPSKGDVVWAIGLPIHCGIYEGNNTVIHFAPLDGSKAKKDAVIHRSSLEEFANGSPYLVIEFPPEKCLPPEETIGRAGSRLGEKAYDLLFNNCEHFTTWCKMGEHRSLQIDFIKKIAVAVGDLIDESTEKQTACGKTAKIIGNIHEIVEICSSPAIK